MVKAAPARPADVPAAGGPDGTDAPPPAVPLALVVGVAAISFAAIFFRLAQPTHPLVAAGIRLLAASLVLAPWTVRALRRGHLTPHLLRAGALAGALYGLHFGAWVWSLGLTSVAASVTLVTATPVLLAVVALWTGKDRPTPRLWLSILLAVTGVAIIGGHDVRLTGSALAGDALAVLGCAAMAGYLLLARSLGPRLLIFPFAGVATGVGGLLLMGGAAILGAPLRPASLGAFGYLLLAALIPQLVGHSCLTWALRHTGPTVVGLATVGEPVGATLLAIVWLGEGLRWPVAVGCLITLSAVALAVASTGRHRPRGG